MLYIKKFLIVLVAILCLFSFQSKSFAIDSSDNVVIVFDDSGSMDENLGTMRKIDAAKKALLELVNDIPLTTNVGLVSFHKGWLYELGPMNKDVFTKAVKRLSPDSQTPLSKFIKIGADKLLEQREKQLNYGTSRLLIATDGNANDSDDYKKFVPEIMSRGITVDVIGVGMESKHDLANRVHTYYNADNPENLVKAVKKVFAEVGAKENTVSSKEVYDLMDTLPDGFAETVIKALSKVSNVPIGEKEKVAEASSSSATQSQGIASAPSGGSVQDDSIPIILIVVVLIFFLVLIGFVLGIIP